MPIRSKQSKDTFFLNHIGVVSLFAIVLIIFSYFFLDRPIAYYFYKSSSSIKSAFTLTNKLIDPFINLLIWPTVAYLCYYIFKRTSLGIKVLLITFSVSVCNVIIALVKMIAGRARPELLFSKEIYGFKFFTDTNDYLSFPSGHGVTIMAIAGSLACIFPKYSFYLCFAGFLLSFGMVVMNYHYVSDVIASAWIALIISQWIYAMMKDGNASLKS